MSRQGELVIRAVNSLDVNIGLDNIGRSNGSTARQKWGDMDGNESIYDRRIK